MRLRNLLWPSALFGLMAAAPLGRPAETVYHDNVVIVLDASGSMKNNLAGTGTDKMNAAKRALKTVLENVPPTTRIGLLVFSGSGVPQPWIYPLGPRDDAELARAIDRPKAAGGTPLGRFIKIGADRLLEERAKQFGYGSYRLLIVTDGEAQDQDLVDAYVPDVLSRGITVDVIGVGMQEAHTLATKVHSYRRADDPASLEQAVAAVLAEVARPRAVNAQAEAFELIAPLPTEVAAAALQALSTSGNEPIGGAARRVREAPPARSGQMAPVAQPVQHRRRGISISFMPITAIVLLFGVAFIFVLVRALAGGGRR